MVLKDKWAPRRKDQRYDSFVTILFGVEEDGVILLEAGRLEGNSVSFLCSYTEEREVEGYWQVPPPSCGDC
jgi:hypothetical protein